MSRESASDESPSPHQVTEELKLFKRTPLAVILNQLLEVRRRPDGEKYTDKEIAAWFTATDKPSISRTYLWKLRTGRQEDLKTSHAAALAEFFDVNSNWFIDPAAARTAAAEMDLLLALRHSQAKTLALRGSELSPKRLQDALAYVEQLRQQDQAEAQKPQDADQEGI